MSRHHVLLIRLRQTVIDIWSVSPKLLLEDDVVQRFCEAFTVLHERLEDRILDEISKNGNAGYGHSHPLVET